MALAQSTGSKSKKRGPSVLQSGKAVAGLVIVGFFLVVAIFGPMLAPYDPSTVSYDVLQPPSADHWFGTTQTGQDIFSQMLYGARISMIVGLAAAAMATTISVTIGLTAGYLGGLSDDLLSLLANIFLVLPGLPLTIILITLIPDSGSIGIILIIGVTGWAWGARVLRAQTLSLRKRDFVEAARATGRSRSSIIFREILPNQLAVIASSFLGTVTGAILTQASLAFLGLTSVSEWSWGTILYWAQVSSALVVNAWWWFIPAGLAIALLGTGMSLLNFGIDEFINPRLRAAGMSSGREERREQRAAKKRAQRPARFMKSDVEDASHSVAQGDPEIALVLEDVVVQYGRGDTATRAVNHVSLEVRRGEVLGIAGESGSGKSTLAHAITRLHKPPAEISNGRVLYNAPDGTQVDILAMGPEELRKFRWDELSIVFQSAMHALNPVMTIGDQIDDTLMAHRAQMPKAERRERALELLDLVGIARDRINAYPHELSGGMRQRAMISIGLALEPQIIVMDEPTTALDVVIQRQIIEKLVELKEKLGFTIVFITHDLSLLLELSDKIAIMYGGKVVEIGPAEDFISDSQHPYTQGLLGSFPTLSGPRKELQGIPGSPPDLKKLGPGCAFKDRCKFAQAVCETDAPKLVPSANAHTRVACHIFTSPELFAEQAIMVGEPL